MKGREGVHYLVTTSEQQGGLNEEMLRENEPSFSEQIPNLSQDNEYF